MLISSPTEVSLLLAHKDAGSGEVAWWHSMDGGLSFTKGEVLISRDNTSFMITSMIRNAHPDARVITAGNDKSNAGNYRKLYLLGDNGPVKRLKTEADNLVD